MGTSGLCWVETTTAGIRSTAPFSPYWTVTWLLPSGRSQSTRPSLRTWARRRESLWA